MIDDTLVAMLAIGEDGATLGTVVDWSSHPEALGSDNTLVTSDFPHFLRKRMEAGLGGTCVFLVGSIGGLMTPLGLKLAGAGRPPVPADSFALAQAVGERAADAALEALARGRRSASSALEHRSATVFVPLENRLFRLAMFLGVLDRELFSEAARPRACSATTSGPRSATCGSATPRRSSCRPRSTPSSSSGGSRTRRTPGPTSRAPRASAPLFTLLSSEYRLVLGLANDEIGYVIPRSQWDAKKPFAYGRSEDQYGEVNSVGPPAAARLVEAFERLLGR